MVQGKNELETKGNSLWIDVDGKEDDKYVLQQGMILTDLILNKLKDNPELAKDIYVISPFKNVAYQLIKLLNQINFTIRDEGKVTNIGTVHTFQGIEASEMNHTMKSIKEKLLEDNLKCVKRKMNLPINFEMEGSFLLKKEASTELRITY